MKTILILEDNDERIASFRKAVATLGPDFALKVWCDAPSMCAECESHFPTAALISLSYGDDPRPWETGLDAARFLAQARPVCPAIIHSTDTDHACSMENELRFADWIVERLIPTGKNWIETVWLQKAVQLVEGCSNTWPARLPVDHDERLKRTFLSFDGLSVGDGFGECFFTSSSVIERRLEHRDPPPGPWFITDDTMMALSIVRCLQRYGHIQQDALAAAFAREYARDPQRGYGGTAHGILRSIGEGTSWKTAAQRVFGGEGSCGNGGAMRSAPIGAYFADDYDRVNLEAKLSAEVTHAHPDGQTGAAAVALASAWMIREGPSATPSHDVIEFVLGRIPQTETYYRLKKSLELPLRLAPQTAASVLGNGTQVIASDTVPFCLWCAARHVRNYTEALWATVSGLGDRDTTCAIVGGIVALSAGRESIPIEWLKAREPIQI
jgi:ADP-ribosylglycohydrolase